MIHETRSWGWGMKDTGMDRGWIGREEEGVGSGDGKSYPIFFFFFFFFPLFVFNCGSIQSSFSFEILSFLFLDIFLSDPSISPLGCARVPGASSRRSPPRAPTEHGPRNAGSRFESRLLSRRQPYRLEQRGEPCGQPPSREGFAMIQKAAPADGETPGLS